MIRSLTPRPAQNANGPAWLVTFADVIALLLAFFVMIYASHRVELGDWQAVVESLSRSFKAQTRPLEARRTADRNAEASRTHQGADLDYLETLITDIRDDQPALEGMSVLRFPDRLVIGFPGEMLFASGRADPTPAARRRIALLANLLSNIPNRIDVFGHADPGAVPGLVFESNRELSLARADAVAGMMANAGYGRPIGAFGLSDSHYPDLRHIQSRTLRKQLARRVDIVLRNRISDP